MSNKVGFTALNFALAALGNDSSGEGGGTGGTVSVKVDSTITGQPGTQASVVNLGNDTNVLLQFTIPQGAMGSQWYISKEIPGTVISGLEDNDCVLYSTGQIYQYDGTTGTMVDTQVNILGYSPKVTVKTNTNTEYVLMITSLQDGVEQITETPNLKGQDGKNGSTWYTSTEADGSPVIGSVDGDYILYASGKIYKVENGIPADTGINLATSGGTNPYQYAVDNGYQGTEEEFVQAYTNVLTGSLVQGNNKVIVSSTGVEIKGVVDAVDPGDAVSLGFLEKYLNNMILDCGTATTEETNGN